MDTTTHDKEGMQKIFEKDGDGCYVNLVIPPIGGLRSLDLRGKKDLELTPEEITTKKIYCHELYSIVARDREELAYGNC